MKKLFTLFALLMTIVIGAKAGDYQLASSTCAEDKKTWTFESQNFVLDQAHGGAGQSGYTDYIKFSKGKTYTLTLPANFTLTNINVKGYTNSNGKTDGELTSVAGTAQTSKTFPAKNDANLSTATQITDGYDFAISNQKGGTVAFTTANTNQICVLITLTGTFEAATAPTITDQPAACTVLALNGTTTLSVDATPSSGTCTFNWYACDSEGVISGESLGTSKDYTVPTSATASAATLYYRCVVGDGGSNTTPSDVAKINVIDRAAKQTWDFTTIDAEDIMYNETFYTYKGNSIYNHNFTKATDGTLQDNYGNDLLNGIIVRRDAGDAAVYVYCDATNNRYGINLQGASDKPGIWKIPVEAGKNYQITYTSNTSSKTVGYAINSGATFVSGDLTAEITTAFTNTASFIASASANGTMVLHNAGTDANNCTIVKIEEVAASPSLIVDPSTAEAFSYVEGNGPSAAQTFAVTLNNSENPVSAQLSSSNYEMSKTGEADSYTSEAFDDLTNGSTVYVRLKAGLAKASAYDATLTFANADVEDDVVINLSGSVTGQTYTVTYDLNGGSGDAPTQDPVEAGTQITLPAAASKDFYTFNGWLCNADNVVYDAEALYTMTAANTTFTAQWTGPSYSSTLDFAAKTLAGETSGTLAEFLATGNMICSGIATRSAWETQTTDKKVGFWGYKLKDINATVKFMVQAGKRVTITLGSIGATTTLKKNGVSEPVSTNSGDTKQNVITFDADVDMLVEIVVGQDNKTVTLNKIAIEDAIAATNVTVGTTGFATIGLPYATTLPEGVTAYAVSSVEGSKAVMSEAIAAGTVIPANRGLVIVADPANSPYAFAEFVGTQQFDLSGNELKATGINEKAATEQAPIYVLAITDAQKKKVGFKKSTSGSLGAYKAYLPGTVATTNSLTMDFDDPTAINGVTANDNLNVNPNVKVVKNGQLFIGNYTVAGARVK